MGIFVPASLCVFVSIHRYEVRCEVREPWGMASGFVLATAKLISFWSGRASLPYDTLRCSAFPSVLGILKLLKFFPRWGPIKLFFTLIYIRIFLIASQVAHILMFMGRANFLLCDTTIRTSSVFLFGCWSFFFFQLLTCHFNWWVEVFHFILF